MARKWEAALREVGLLVDKLGTPLDSRILETVAALRYLGVNTTGSCSGHLDRVTGGPYVIFESTEARGYTARLNDLGDFSNPTYKQAFLEAAKLNALERQKLLPLLDKFYKNRDVPFEQRLIIKSFGPAASYLCCQGAETAYAATHTTQKLILKTCQAEMRAFTEFLKSRIED